MTTRINVVIRLRPLLEHEYRQGDTTELITLDEGKSTIKYIMHDPLVCIKRD